MIDWSDTRTAISGWITSVTGLPCVWKYTSDQNKWTGVGRVIASISNGQNKSQYDEVVYTHRSNAPLGERLEVKVVSHRVYTLGFMVEVFNQDGDADALYYSGIIRTSARAPSVLSALEAVNVGLAGVLSEVPVEVVFERRFVSCAQLDLRINVCAEYSDTNTTYIEKLDDAEMTAEDSDGNTIVKTTKDYDLR